VRSLESELHGIGRADVRTASVSASNAQQLLHAVDYVTRALGPALDGALAARLVAYVEHVATWNRKINLTAAREPEALCEVMLADACVMANTDCIAHAVRVIDVGSGAGAPIVPLLLMRPDLSALCVEPLQKRATFLRMLSARLGLLGRMRVHQAKLDLETPQLGEAFDVASSRATFAPEVWLRAGLALASSVLVLTATDEAPAQPAGVTLALTRDYELPFSRAPRRVWVYRRA
jgi:16S rRNA (guanine527-N7)-methyltransferase